ncbi:heavy metal-associated domain-containing protein [Nocardioides sp.]|jgi:copper chaperone CopZ|uniref:heavy-metal-associated domain-containing protein n=1 Tax=Nocardioides sp. TaxID=35761 RepID=UPI0019C175CA|nr:heavy metal-associated domain-containing protein [Nocardioides sp.]MBC7278513.1 heavy-metal-associated domain-containing protein [Nocardioides sp.]
MCSTTYTVSGMTCGHCVGSVKEEVTQIPGVSSVDVDLATGQVTVTSENELDPVQVQRAVEEAGYQLAG